MCKKIQFGGKNLKIPHDVSTRGAQKLIAINFEHLFRKTN